MSGWLIRFATALDPKRTLAIPESDTLKHESVDT
jgi:hypothetical protein